MHDYRNQQITKQITENLLMSIRNLNIKILILLASIFFYNTAGLSASTQPDSLVLGIYFITTADKLYHSQELPGNLELALSYYKKALQHSKWLPDVEWKLARCYWTLAAKSVNQTKRAAHYAEGIRFGNEAVRKHPDISNSYAWLALNVGSSALNEGIVKSLYKRDVIKSGFEKAIELNPVNAVALIGLANWYHHIPAFLGGDRQKDRGPLLGF